MGMRERRALFGASVGVRRGSALLALVVTAAVALIGSAQAGNTSKPFTANVYRTIGTASDFTIKLTNDPHAQQTLGSANFTAPAGFAVHASTQPVTSSDGHSWTLTSDGTRLVSFRANSNGDALGKGAFVVASFTVDVPAGSLCASALWGVQVKQSNDFSGQPGNDFTLSAAGSDLTPLGSFTFARIGTVLDSPAGLFVPQRRISDGATPVSVRALDTCGAFDADYNGVADLSRTATQVPTRLENAAFSLGFSAGVGTGSVTPTDVEAADTVTATDRLTGISTPSTVSGTAQPNEAFDVVETICAGPGAVCDWQNKKGSITAHSTVDNTVGDASLGFGFRSLAAVCASRDPIGPDNEVVDINPHNYAGPYQLTLTYAKSVSGTGPASGFVFCLSEDNLQTWQAIPACSATLLTRCIVSQKRVTGGALQFVLSLDPGDPWGGGFG
jgi:hypothetical protein